MSHFLSIFTRTCTLQECGVDWRREGMSLSKIVVAWSMQDRNGQWRTGWNKQRYHELFENSNTTHQCTAERKQVMVVLRQVWSGRNKKRKSDPYLVQLIECIYIKRKKEIFWGMCKRMEVHLCTDFVTQVLKSLCQYFYTGKLNLGPLLFVLLLE